MYRFFCFCFCCWVCTASAQQPLPCTQSCCFSGDLPETPLYGFESDHEAQAAVKAIMRHTGLPANFTILAGNVPNAAAVVYENTRYIVYNQMFMLAVRDVTHTNWSLVSILVHEIGHHLSGHTLDQSGSRPDRELEADRFSGFVLFRMGATLDQARIAMETVASETGSATHPPKSARLAAITNGWLAARDLVAPGISEKKTDKVPAPSGFAARFSQIKVEKTVQNGRKGLLVKAQLETDGLKNQSCRAVAWFYDANGKPLRDLNRQFATAAGCVAVTTAVRPRQLRGAVDTLSIFIPLEELHLKPGTQGLRLNLGLYQGEQPVGKGSNYVFFEME